MTHVRFGMVKKLAALLTGRRSSGAAQSGVGVGVVDDMPAYGSLLQSRSNPLLVSTVYRCVDLISDSVASLPVETYMMRPDGFKDALKGHAVHGLLSLEPNDDMSAYVFLKAMVTSLLLTGNGYSYIERNSRTGAVEQLIFLPASFVSPLDRVGEDGVWRRRYLVGSYRGRVFGTAGEVHPHDMLHVKNFTYDGLSGVSTLEHARRSLKIADASDRGALSYFGSGGRPGGVVTVEGPPLTKEERQNIYDVIGNRLERSPNGTVILEGHMKYQPITISPKDSQLLESRVFNVVDICRFFSVSPVKAFDLSKSSYSTLEASQLSYLSETVQPYLVRFEQEFNRKLFLGSERGKVRVEFDTTEFLRTDKQNQASYLRHLFEMGAITPNEVRRTTNLSRIDGGDEAFIQMNMQSLRNASAESRNACEDCFKP